MLESKKTYSAKVDRCAQKYRGRPLYRPCQPFWGTLVAILDFAGDSMFLIEGVRGSKNLFSESCSEQPYYYREVILDFYLGGLRLVKGEGKQKVAQIKKLI